MQDKAPKIDKNPVQVAVAIARKYFIYVGIVSLFLNLSMLAVPMYMLQLYDRVLTSRSESTLLLLTVVAVFVIALVGLLELVRSRVLVRLGRWFDQQLRRWLIHLSLITGRDSQAIRDLDEYRVFLAGPGLLALMDAPWAPVFIGLVFVLHPLLGTIALVGAIVLGCLAVANEILTRQPLSEAAGRAARANRFAELASRNADVILAMAMSKPLITKWEEERNLSVQLQALGSDRAGLISALAKFVRLGLQIAILGVGAWLAVQEITTPGVMIAASIITARALQPIETAIGAWRNVIGARNAYHRLNEFLDANPPSPERMSLPAMDGSIQAEGLCYFVPDREEPIIKNVSFRLEPGEILGITGPSAAGKSTLARLLVGAINPHKGQLKIGDFDINAWNRSELGVQLGFMPQDVELFDGRIDENIARFAEFESESIVEAAKAAGVDTMISSMPLGFNTEIGVGGQVLSGGQRQRIALARAIYQFPKIVVLDEPSSNLDTDGDYALMQAIGELKRRGITVVIIAHRPNLLMTVDKVMVLHDGNVAEFGPASEVIPKITRPVSSQQVAVANAKSTEDSHGSNTG